MATKLRKIGFYYLTISNDEIEPISALNRILDYINNLNKVDRKITISGKKFGLLDNINSNNQRTNHKLIFKSATHSFRPPLIDKNTVDERESPKTIDEGEIQKTHFIAKTINGDIIIVLEKTQSGLSMKQVVKYLNNFVIGLDLDEEDDFSFKYEIIAKDDFLEEINGLDRVVSADVYVEKQVLGGDALRFSDRTDTVQHEIVVSVKAERMSSIKEFVRDAFSVLNNGERSVTRISLVGRNDENNIIKINTDLIERQEYINPTINEVTGEILSSEIFVEMNSVIQNF